MYFVIITKLYQPPMDNSIIRYYYCKIKQFYCILNVIMNHFMTLFLINGTNTVFQNTEHVMKKNIDWLNTHCHCKQIIHYKWWITIETQQIRIFDNRYIYNFWSSMLMLINRLYIVHLLGCLHGLEKSIWNQSWNQSWK